MFLEEYSFPGGPFFVVTTAEFRFHSDKRRYYYGIVGYGCAPGNKMGLKFDRCVDPDWRNFDKIYIQMRNDSCLFSTVINQTG